MYGRFIKDLFIVPLVLSLAMVSAAFAQKSDARTEIEARLEQRYPQLLAAEDKGKIGENWRGLVEAVDKQATSDPKIAKLIEEENSDRKQLYQIIAADESAKTKSPVSPNEVAERNAMRKFQKAKPDHFLKARNDAWIQKRDVSRFKKDGKIGETWDGYLASVEGAGKGDPQVDAILETENSIRKDEYQRLAHKQGGSMTEVAEKAGRQNIEQLPAGQWYKAKDGGWQKKK